MRKLFLLGLAFLVSHINADICEENEYKNEQTKTLKSTEESNSYDDMMDKYNDNGRLKNDHDYDNKSSMKTDSHMSSRPYQDLSKHPVKLDLSFLYWRASESDLAYAISPTITGAAGAGEHAIQGAMGKFKYGSFDWSPGFKVRLGYINQHNVEPYFQYTWYYSKGKDSVIGPTSGTMALNSAFDTTTASRVVRITSNIKLHYNIPDLILAKRGILFSNNNSIFSLFGGVKGAFIKQRWIIKQHALAANDVEVTDSQWKYYGGGFLAGADFQQNLGAGFQFLANLQGASLYGKWKEYQREDVTIYANPMEDFKINENRFIQTLQYAVGLAWKYDMDSVAIRLSAMYDVHRWYNLHEIIVPIESSFLGGKVTTTRHNNTTLQGLTASLGIDY